MEATMAKQDYNVSIITKAQCADILLKYHYLKDISKGFKSGINFGLYKGQQLVGTAIFTGFPVPELVVGMFGLPRTEQGGFYELSRLCLTPDVQQEEHNLATWFLSKCIKALRKQEPVRAILSYADAGFHNGTVYRASNFAYYGLSDAKKDFWIRADDGSYRKHSRGSVKGVNGEWRDRSRKHRFVIVYDNTLNMKWIKQ
jgi:hypothetical protein